MFERPGEHRAPAQRVPRDRHEEADRIAEPLGDLPIAVAAAGAWLAETGTTVDEYLRQIEQHGPRVPGPRPPVRVEATWDLSLNRLQERSPAAYRLLQLCSVLAPEIALDLVYSDEMAAALLARTTRRCPERHVAARWSSRSTGWPCSKLDQRGEPADRSRCTALLQHVVRARMTEEELGRRHSTQVHLVLAAVPRPSGEVRRPRQLAAVPACSGRTWRSPARCDCPDEPVRQLLIDRVRYLCLRGDLGRGPASWPAQIERPGRGPHQLTGTQSPPIRARLRPAPAAAAPAFQPRQHPARPGPVRRVAASSTRPVLRAAAAAAGRTEHPHTLMTAGSLAGDLRGLGRYAEALALDETTYAAWLESLGEDHPAHAVRPQQPRRLLPADGRLPAAYAHDVRVHRERQSVLSDNHPNTLVTAGNLGRDLRDAGEYDQSVATIATVVEVFAPVSGPRLAGCPHGAGQPGGVAAEGRPRAGRRRTGGPGVREVE